MLFLGLLLSGLVTGCASAHRQSSATNQTGKKEPTRDSKSGKMLPINMIKGRVAFVNSGARFAVIDFYASGMPENGQQLAVFRNDQKVGEIKISGPNRDHNTVGDIVAGEAQVGDLVRPE